MIKNNQAVYGITGTLGSGKTTLAKMLYQKYMEKHSIKINLIELDDIRRNSLWYSNSLDDIDLRKRLAYSFNLKIGEPYFNIDRIEFTKLIFNSKKELKQYSDIASPYFKQKVVKMICNNHVSFIVWTNLIEDNYIDLISKQVIILHSSPSIVYERVSTQENFLNLDMQKRLNIEKSYKSKIRYLVKNNIHYISVNNNLDVKNLEKFCDAFKHEL